MIGKLSILIVAYCSFLPVLNATERETQITGTITNRVDSNGDTIVFRYWKNLYSTSFVDNNVLMPYKEYKVPVIDGVFIVKTSDIDEIGYYNLYYKPHNEKAHKNLFLLGYIEPGDSLNHIVDSANIQVTGRGYEKQVLKLKLDSLSKLYISNRTKFFGKKLPSVTHLNQIKKAYFEEALHLIEEYRNKLPSFSWQLIKTDFLSWNIEYHFLYPVNLEIANLKASSDGQKDIVYAKYADSVLKELDFDKGFIEKCINTIQQTDEEVKLKSCNYPIFLYNYWKVSKALESGNGMDLFDYTRSLQSSQLKERMWVYYFTMKFGQSYDGSDNIPIRLLDEALSMMNYPSYKVVLMNLRNAKSEGTMAYNFKLPNIDGDYVQLSDFSGKFVFVDFWFSGCVGCYQYYLNTLSKVEEFFENNNNVVFISINVDKEKQVWLESLEKGIYSTLGKNNVINLYTDGLGLTHDVVKKNGLLAYPSLLFINPERKIISVNGFRGLSVDETLEKIYSYINAI